MFIDLSVFKNIDFRNSDNLLFFSIVLFLTIVVFFIFFFIIAEIIAFIKRIFRVKEGYVIEELDKIEKIRGEIKNSGDKEPLQKQRLTEGAFAGSFAQSGEKEQSITEKIDFKKADDQKIKQKIAEQLGKFKKDSAQASGSFEKNMPSRDVQKDGKREIEIPVAKKITAGQIPAKSQEGLLKETAKETIVDADGNVRVIAPAQEPQQKFSANDSDVFKKDVLGEKSVLEPPDFMEKEKQVAPTGRVENKSEGGGVLGAGTVGKNEMGTIMFGNKDEISRIDLRQKLRYDPKIYKAQRETGLYNLNRTTRAQLEKDIFPAVYGRNISKRDLRINLKRLGREWASASDMNKKALLRKEIKFLKKIGGV